LEKQRTPWDLSDTYSLPNLLKVFENLSVELEDYSVSTKALPLHRHVQVGLLSENCL